MTCNAPYISPFFARYLKRILFKALFLFSVLFLVHPTISGQEVESEEIMIYLHVKNVGGTEMPAYIKGEVIYLPISNLFTFLKIQNSPDPDFDSVTGSFITPDSKFVVLFRESRVVFMGKTYPVNPGDMIRTENNLYLKMNYFGEIFGLECAFSFRSFSVFLTSKAELPVIRQMRQEMMRANINKLKGDMQTDTFIRRRYPFFSFGAVDWNLTTTEVVNGPVAVQGSLTMGALLAGGEVTLSLNAGNLESFSANRQFWQWHFANNDFRVVKQIYLGKIPTLAVSSVYAPVIGAYVTNTPTTFRRSFGTWILNDYTQPGWIVELYVNYVLVDYTKADASGYFSFEVPLVYGNSNVKLRFYGPWGEEHTREQSIVIPFNFLPFRKFEYAIRGGVLENSERSVFSRADLFYGVSRRVTIGGGVEYLSSVYKNKPMPFVNLSARIGSGLIVSAEYMHFVRFRGVMNWRLPASFLLEGYYTRYDPNQKAVFNAYLEERKLILSKTMRFTSFPMLMRLTLDQVIMPRSRSFSTEFLLSGSYRKVNVNLTTYAFLADPAPPYIFSDLAFEVRLPAKFIVTPQVQYVYTMNQFLSFKLKVEKQIFRNGLITLSYDRSFTAEMDNLMVGFRYDFPFAQTILSARYGAYNPSFMQNLRGSLVYKGKEGGVGFSNISSVGRGGITLVAFLDLNGNGKWEKKQEPKIPAPNVHINGGRILKIPRDSTIQVSELEPYNKYFIELDCDRFDNIAWRIPKPTIGITINPNQYTLVEVPVVVAGEVSGFVYLLKDTLQKGQGGIYFGIYRSDSTFVTRILTESDGYFSHFGLTPGSYYLMPDTTQLFKIRKSCTPRAAHFTIKQTRDGDFVGDIAFFLRSSDEDTVPAFRTKKVPEVAEAVPRTDAQEKDVQAPHVVIPTATKEHLIPAEKPVDKNLPELPPAGSESKSNPPAERSISSDSLNFSIQLGAFRFASNAKRMQAKMSQFPGHAVVISYEDRYHKVRITGFGSYDEAHAFMVEFVRKFVPEAFIHKKRAVAP